MRNRWPLRVLGFAATQARAVAVSVGLLMLFAASFAAEVRTNNSPSAFLLKDSRETHKLDELRGAFTGGAQFMRLVLHRPAGGFPADMGQRVHGLRQGLLRQPDCKSLIGPSDFGIDWGSLATGRSSAPRAQRGPRADLAASLGILAPSGAFSLLLGYTATSDEAEQRLLTLVERRLSRLSRDRSSTQHLPPSRSAPRDQSTADEPARGEKVRGEILRGEAVGLAPLHRALAESTEEIRRKFFPAFALVSALVLGLALRGFFAALACMLTVAASLIFTFALMHFAGVELNLVLVILPTLLFAVALATTVHLVLRYFRFRRCEGATPRSAALAMIADKVPTVVLMGLTSGAGFGSLGVSQVQAVRQFGLWAAAGVALITLCSVVLLPALLCALRVRAPKPLKRSAFGAELVRFSLVHRRAVAWVCLGLALLAAAFIPRIPTESSALHYLHKGHPVRKSVAALERQGVGSAAVEVLFKQAPAQQRALPELGKSGAGSSQAGGYPPGAQPGASPDAHRDAQEDTQRETHEGDEGSAFTLDTLEAAPEGGPGFWHPQALARLARFSRLLRNSSATEGTEPVHRRAAVLGVVSAGDLLVHTAQRSAQAKGAVAAEAYRDADPRFRAFVSREGSLARATVLVPFGGLEALEGLQRRIAAAAAEAGLPAPSITGEYAALLHTQGYLLRTLLLALGLTVGVLALLFFILYRSRRVAFYALLPNLWPVLLLFGLMGVWQIPLDIGTAMVASIALGLAVDDTLHSLEALHGKSVPATRARGGAASDNASSDAAAVGTAMAAGAAAIDTAASDTAVVGTAVSATAVAGLPDGAGGVDTPLAADTPAARGRSTVGTAHASDADRVLSAVGASAPAYVLSAAVLVLGFLTCTLSDFAPTQRFGLLAAFAALLALIGDLFLLPVLFYRAFRKRSAGGNA